jgi:RimJ/RimL family protein N-acetyltransferase
MNIIKNGSIIINNKKYNYKIFDTIGLVDLIRNNKKFTEALENAIKIYRKKPDFHISDLVKEWIYFRPDDVTTYFIVYKKNIIVSTMRFYYNLELQTAYFNLVYTSPEFRGQKICQTNIAYMINLTKKYIKKYELEVDINNLPAVKCYENNGFKKIKKQFKTYHLLRLKIN